MRREETDAADWSAVKAAVAEALALTAPERARFLTGLAERAPRVHAEVASLLAAAERTDDFLDRPARWAPAGPSEDDPAPVVPGFRVLGLLGSGGMGRVYLGEREEDAPFRQRVAIKVVKRGMDSAAVLRRFHAEREILARLEHPFIARLIDGGSTTEGLPYFALEYVEGAPIDRWCDGRGLEIEARLRLFLDVCEAVQYAHRHLVVHRDLKPANVLVDADGRVRLLDFGIAKFLDSASAGETALERPMTPEYASPEQARGEPVSTATDVYSLGVVLQKLLTGELPTASRSAAAVETSATAPFALSERAAAPASAVAARSTDPRVRERAKRLRGELDLILRRALDKEPTRRYLSVEALADDLRRHLANEPIAARPDSFAYRARKFAARHRAPVVLATALLVALVAGGAAALWQAREAQSARARAERRFADVRKLANTFLFDVYDAIDELPGSLPARELVVDRAREYLASLAAEADDPDLVRELARAYQRLGDVQGLPDWSSAGKTSDALASYAQAAELLSRLPRSDDDHRLVLERAELSSHMASVEAARGDYRAALARHREAFTVTDRLWRERGLDEARSESLIHQVAMGDDLWELGDLPGAEREYRAAFDGAEARVAAAPAELRRERPLGVIAQRLGDTLVDLGRAPEALPYFERSRGIDERLLAADPTNAEVQRDLATDAMRMVVAHRARGDEASALVELDKARHLRQALFDRGQDDARSVTDLLESMRFLADAHARRGDFIQATQEAERSIVLSRDLVASDVHNLRYPPILADALKTRADVAAAAGRPREARDFAERTTRVREDLARAAPDNGANLGALGALYVARLDGALGGFDGPAARHAAACRALAIAARLVEVSGAAEAPTWRTGAQRAAPEKGCPP